MKNLFEKFGKKKIYATGIVASIVAVLVFVIFALPHEKPLSLKKETFIVEYGKAISTKAVDYLKTEDTKILDKAKVTIEKMENEKDKDYAKIGTYKAIVKYGEKSKDFTIEVKDTKAPVFKDIMKEIVIEKNAENVDYTKYFQAEDLSTATITVDSEKVDLSKVGDYEINVTATDKYKNAETTTVKVKVVSLEDAKKENGITKALDGTIYQSKALKEKNAEEKKVEEQKVEEEKKQQEVANNTGGTSNGGGSSNNSGGNTNAGGSTPTPPAPSPVPVTPKPTPACDPNAYLSEEDANLVATVGMWDFEVADEVGNRQALDENSPNYMKGYSVIPVFNSCQDVMGYTLYWY